jgi:hypothetical protein
MRRKLGPMWLSAQCSWLNNSVLPMCFADADVLFYLHPATVLDASSQRSLLSTICIDDPISVIEGQFCSFFMEPRGMDRNKNTEGSNFL